MNLQTIEHSELHPKMVISHSSSCQLYITNSLPVFSFFWVESKNHLWLWLYWCQCILDCVWLEKSELTHIHKYVCYSRTFYMLLTHWVNSSGLAWHFLGFKSRKIRWFDWPIALDIFLVLKSNKNGWKDPIEWV